MTGQNQLGSAAGVICNSGDGSPPDGQWKMDQLLRAGKSRSPPSGKASQQKQPSGGEEKKRKSRGVDDKFDSFTCKFEGCGKEYRTSQACLKHIKQGDEPHKLWLAGLSKHAGPSGYCTMKMERRPRERVVGGVPVLLPAPGQGALMLLQEAAGPRP